MPRCGFCNQWWCSIGQQTAHVEEESFQWFEWSISYPLGAEFHHPELYTHHACQMASYSSVKRGDWNRWEEYDHQYMFWGETTPQADHCCPRWGHLSALGSYLRHTQLRFRQRELPQPPLCAVFQKVHKSRGGGVYWLIAAEKDSSHANVTVEVDLWSKGECCVCMALCGISGCRCKVSWWSCTDKNYGTNNNEYKSPDKAWSPSLVIWHKVTGTIYL